LIGTFKNQKENKVFVKTWTENGQDIKLFKSQLSKIFIPKDATMQRRCIPMYESALRDFVLLSSKPDTEFETWDLIQVFELLFYNREYFDPEETKVVFSHLYSQYLKNKSKISQTVLNDRFYNLLRLHECLEKKDGLEEALKFATDFSLLKALAIVVDHFKGSMGAFKWLRSLQDNKKYDLAAPIVMKVLLRDKEIEIAVELFRDLKRRSHSGIKYMLNHVLHGFRADSKLPVVKPIDFYSEMQDLHWDQRSYELLIRSVLSPRSKAFYSFAHAEKNILEPSDFEEPLKVAKILTSRMRDLGIPESVAIKNAFLAYYLKAGRFELLESTISDMETNGPPPNAKTYSILLTLYFTRKEKARVLDVIQKMKDRNLVWDKNAYNLITWGFQRLGMYEQAARVNERKNSRFKSNTADYHRTLALHYNLGDFESANKTLELLKVSGATLGEDVYVTIMRGFVGGNRPDDVFNTFEDMLAAGIKPSSKTFNLLLRFCVLNKDPQKALQVYEDMKRYEVKTDGKTISLLMVVYRMLRDEENLLKVFRDHLDAGSVATAFVFKNLLAFYAQSGDDQKAALVSNFFETHCGDKPSLNPNGLNFHIFRLLSPKTSMEELKECMDELDQAGKLKAPELDIVLRRLYMDPESRESIPALFWKYLKTGFDADSRLYVTFIGYMAEMHKCDEILRAKTHMDENFIAFSAFTRSTLSKYLGKVFLSLSERKEYDKIDELFWTFIDNGFTLDLRAYTTYKKSMGPSLNELKLNKLDFTDTLCKLRIQN
jgi:pentatricopeptide repeat protein